MKKNKKKIAAVLCLIILLSGAFIFCKTRYYDPDLSVKDYYFIEKQFAMSDSLSLKHIMYDEKYRQLYIGCKFNEKTINDKVYDDGIDLYNRIYKYIDENNDNYKNMRMEIHIQNASVGLFLELKNYTLEDPESIYGYCCSAYNNQGSLSFYSDISKFHTKHPDVKFIG